MPREVRSFISDDEDQRTGSRRWRGFANPEANGHIQIFEQLFPLGRDFDFLEPPLDEGLLLRSR